MSTKRKETTIGAEFGLEIRRRRTSLGLTLEELGQRAGLSSNFVGTIEHGTRDPSLSTICSLARGFDIAPRDLLPGGDLSAAAIEAATAFEKAPSHVQEGILLVLQKQRKGRVNKQ